MFNVIYNISHVNSRLHNWFASLVLGGYTDRNIISCGLGCCVHTLQDHAPSQLAPIVEASMADTGAKQQNASMKRTVMHPTRNQTLYMVVCPQSVMTNHDGKHKMNRNK